MKVPVEFGIHTMSTIVRDDMRAFKIKSKPHLFSPLLPHRIPQLRLIRRVEHRRSAFPAPMSFQPTAPFARVVKPLVDPPVAYFGDPISLWLHKHSSVARTRPDPDFPKNIRKTNGWCQLAVAISTRASRSSRLSQMVGNGGCLLDCADLAIKRLLSGCGGRTGRSLPPIR